MRYLQKTTNQFARGKNITNRVNPITPFVNLKLCKSQVRCNIQQYTNIRNLTLKYKYELSHVLTQEDRDLIENLMSEWNVVIKNMDNYHHFYLTDDDENDLLHTFLNASAKDDDMAYSKGSVFFTGYKQISIIIHFKCLTDFEGSSCYTSINRKMITKLCRHRHSIFNNEKYINRKKKVLTNTPKAKIIKRYDNNTEKIVITDIYVLINTVNNMTSIEDIIQLCSPKYKFLLKATQAPSSSIIKDIYVFNNIELDYITEYKQVIYDKKVDLTSEEFSFISPRLSSIFKPGMQFVTRQQCKHKRYFEHLNNQNLLGFYGDFFNNHKILSPDIIFINAHNDTSKNGSNYNEWPQNILLPFNSLIKYVYNGSKSYIKNDNENFHDSKNFFMNYYVTKYNGVLEGNYVNKQLATEAFMENDNLNTWFTEYPKTINIKLDYYNGSNYNIQFARGSRWQHNCFNSICEKKQIETSNGSTFINCYPISNEYQKTLNIYNIRHSIGAKMFKGVPFTDINLYGNERAYIIKGDCFKDARLCRTINFYNMDIYEIKNNAFTRCRSLMEIYIPNGTFVRLHSYLFDGCTLLKKIIFERPPEIISAVHRHPNYSGMCCKSRNSNYNEIINYLNDNYNVNGNEINQVIRLLSIFRNTQHLNNKRTIQIQILHKTLESSYPSINANYAEKMNNFEKIVGIYNDMINDNSINGLFKLKNNVTLEII